MLQILFLSVFNYALIKNIVSNYNKFLELFNIFRLTVFLIIKKLFIWNPCHKLCDVWTLFCFGRHRFSDHLPDQDNSTDPRTPVNDHFRPFFFFRRYESDDKWCTVEARLPSMRYLCIGRGWRQSSTSANNSRPVCLTPSMLLARRQAILHCSGTDSLWTLLYLANTQSHKTRCSLKVR